MKDQVTSIEQPLRLVDGKIILTIGKNWETLFMRMGQSSAINATVSMRLMVYMQS